MSDFPANPRAIGVALPEPVRTRSERVLIDDVRSAVRHLRALMQAAERAGLVLRPAVRTVPIRYVQGSILLDSPVVSVRVMKRVPLPTRGKTA